MFRAWSGGLAIRPGAEESAAPTRGTATGGVLDNKLAAAVFCGHCEWISPGHFNTRNHPSRKGR